jgi:hypothetical protein
MAAFEPRPNGIILIYQQLDINLLVKKSELEILSLQIPSFQQIQARNCVLGFFEHCQSI